MQIANQSINRKVAEVTGRLACSRTVLLTDKIYGLYYGPQVNVDSEDAIVGYQLSDKIPPSVDVVILGKEHYQEESRRFPIQSRRELTKILNLEKQADDEKIILYTIGDYIDGERQVMSWVCERRLFARYQIKPLLVIPETLLLIHDRKLELVTLTRQQRTFWLYNNNGNYLTASKKGLISNANLFKASAGLSADIAEKQLDESNYLTHLLADLSLVMLKYGLGLTANLRKFEAVDMRQYLKYCGLSAASLFAIYFSATSLYLELRLAAAQTAGQDYGSKTQEIFDLKAKLTQAQQKRQQLEAVVNQPGASSVLWRLVSPLLQDGVQIDRIYYLPDGLVIISGVADSDTKVLEFLNKDDEVLQPQLRAATTTIKGKDNFSISLRFKGNS